MDRARKPRAHKWTGGHSMATMALQLGRDSAVEATCHLGIADNSSYLGGLVEG